MYFKRSILNYNPKIERQKGFTLIELIVVVIIVGVLAAVSVPLYTSYIHRAKASEGEAIVGALVSAQKSYWQRYKIFTDDIAKLNVDIGEVITFDFSIESADAISFSVKADVNATGVADGLPAGEYLKYSYNRNNSPRGKWDREADDW
ncbi:MAG: prepilin-type N-terminal cleavage/methylation domain-containing protein [Thermodesulfobacteriota bacterium]|nr:prepilin-type N-terminal cleavage/methylation domain-containing protein [Thermodesulfobacteriota bacterium]